MESLAWVAVSSVRKEGEPFRRRPRPGQIIPISNLGGVAGRFCLVAGGRDFRERSRLNLDFNNSPSPGDGRTSEPKNSGLGGLRIIARGWRGILYSPRERWIAYNIARSSSTCRQFLHFSNDPYFLSLIQSVSFRKKHLLRVVEEGNKELSFYEDRGRKGVT